MKKILTLAGVALGLLLGAATPALADKVFKDPRIDGYRIDRCLNNAKNCGRPAADKFCRIKGYDGSLSYREERARPTLILNDDKICDHSRCDGFAEIVCSGGRHDGRDGRRDDDWRDGRHDERRAPARTFNYPKVGGYYVDRCERWAKNCGQGGANEFCRSKGFDKAVDYRTEKMRPTLVLKDDKVCNHSRCEGFARVTCVDERGGSKPNHGWNDNRGWTDNRGDTRTFSWPTVDGYRVDRCLHWARDCGRPAATSLCRIKGYDRAIAHTEAKTRPTLVLGDDKICDEGGCDGLKSVTCQGRNNDPRGGRWDNDWRDRDDDRYKNKRTRTFDRPQMNGLHVDLCLNFGRNCGEPSADRFCKSKGYRESVEFRYQRMAPTYVQGDDRVCPAGFCAGFTSVTCTK